MTHEKVLEKVGDISISYVSIISPVVLPNSYPYLLVDTRSSNLGRSRLAGTIISDRSQCPYACVATLSEATRGRISFYLERDILAPRYPVALVRRSGGHLLRLRKHK